MEHTIFLSSKDLTQTETHCANIEREFLALVCGAEKFHAHIFRPKETIVESDQKPLEKTSADSSLSVLRDVVTSEWSNQ